jgi:eukaryotic-like serine/threonine-protein kinase
VESTTLTNNRRRRPRDAPSSAPAADALVLGRYRLRERLGAGGFGVVWSAHDELLHREVAVKRIPLAPEEDGERASREALASARLAHPAIVALYEACPAADAFYLISELVDGPTLARLIDDDELDDEELLEIGVALCSALAHAHARGVIHRDVKPQNVLIPDRPDTVKPLAEAFGGVAKLTDFGGARLSGQDVLTRTGDVLGTLAYMAPEQSDGREGGEPGDICSLPPVMYEALSGVQPVRGATPAETVRRIGRPVPSLARARRDLSRELTRAIDRALAQSPSSRGTLAELRAAFERELGEHGQTRETPAREERRERQPTRLLPRRADAHRLVADEQRADQQEQDDPTQLGTPPLAGWSDQGPFAQASPVEPAAPVRIPRASRRGLPRVVWFALALALAVWQAASGRPGAALLVLVALLPIAALPIGRRDRPGTGGWPLCALAPALGLIGLAAAFPAVAGQAPRWRMRAALGALGYWWLVLAEPLADRQMWLGPHAGTPARAAWEGSLSSAAAHVVWPLLSVSVLLGALLWALAAALLPLLVRGRGAALDVVAVTVWTALVVLVTSRLDGSLATAGAAAAPRGLVLGAVLGGAFAVAARALRGPV